MQIVHERASQRMHHRITAPFHVQIGGREHRAVDWSIGGFRLDGLEGDLPEVGALQWVECTLPFQGFQVSFKARTRVARTAEETRTVGYAFEELGDREVSLMTHFVDELVRGSMTDVEDTIQRIDTPVTPVSTEPDANPVHSVPIKRWQLKPFLMAALYLGLGLFVFGYIALFVYAALFKLEIDSAVVTAARQQISAPVRGRITEIAVREGDKIFEGDVIARFRDMDAEKIRRDASEALLVAESRLQEAESLLREEEKRADGYALVARNNIVQASAQIQTLQFAKETAALKLERYRDLFRKGFVRREELEAVELEYNQAQSELERKRIHLEELERLMEQGASVQLYAGNGFAGRLSEARAAAERLREEVSRRRAMLNKLSWAEEEIVVRAPFTGVVKELAAVERQTTRPGDVIGLVEQRGQESAVAYLTQEEVTEVRNGAKATLYLPAQDRWIDARVSEIDRTEGFVDEVSQTYRFRNPEARSARVMLQPETTLPLQPGAPVTVYFDRHRGDSVFRLLESWWDR